MILTHTCAVCGWPWLDERQRSSGAGGSYEICVCCGFQPGYTDDDRGFSVEGWRRRWIGSGMLFRSADDELPPPGWDPAAQLEVLLTWEVPPLPDLPDSSLLRGVLEMGNLPWVVQLLSTSTVLVALAGPVADNGSVVLEKTGHHTEMLVFTGPQQWHAWANAPGMPRQAAVPRGSDLVENAETFGADLVVVDLGGPSSLLITLEQLRVLTALPPLNP